MGVTLSSTMEILEFPINEELEKLILLIKESRIAEERIFPRSYDPTPLSRAYLAEVEGAIERI